MGQIISRRKLSGILKFCLVSKPSLTTISVDTILYCITQYHQRLCFILNGNLTVRSIWIGSIKPMKMDVITLMVEEPGDTLTIPLLEAKQLETFGVT